MLCTPTTAAAHCRTVLADLNSMFPTALATAALLWAWDRLDLSYVTLTHFEGAVFNRTGWVVAPTGNASAPLFTYGPIGGPVVVEFAVQKGKVAGFGISGGFWGAYASVGEPKGRPGLKYGSMLSAFDI
ncbi:hypothetical protein B0H13DRAFT_2013116, partial [Mycena leptocephala]